MRARASRPSASGVRPTSGLGPIARSWMTRWLFACGSPWSSGSEHAECYFDELARQASSTRRSRWERRRRYVDKRVGSGLAGWNRISSRPLRALVALLEPASEAGCAYAFWAAGAMATTVQPVCCLSGGISVLQYRQIRPVSTSIGAPQIGHAGRRWARVEAPGGRLNVQYSEKGISSGI